MRSQLHLWLTFYITARHFCRFCDNMAFESRHICLLGDFNFPKTDWSTFSSSSARETGFLNILDDYELCPTILSSTHNCGNYLDNILVPSTITGCFASIRIRKYAYTEPGIVTFCSLWQSYTFLNYPFADKVANFYHHLCLIVKQSFRSVTRKGRPCHPTTHPILHTLNKLATSKRKYHSGHDLVRNLDDTLEKSLEPEKVLYISWKVTSDLDSCFKLVESFKKKSLPHPMFSGSLKLGSWIDVANAFNDFLASNFNTNLFRIFFNCVILNCQFPEIWKLSSNLSIKELAGTTSPGTVQLAYCQRSY